MNPCGCKGDRFCLLCKEELVLLKEKSLNTKKQFTYCSQCTNRAFRPGLENHQSHLENLIEFEDYVTIEGVFVSDEVIDLDLENELVNRIDQDSWLCSQSGRRKQDFGPKINFKKRKLKVGNFHGLPRLSMNILEQLIDRNESIKGKLNDFRVVEVCHLEYRNDRGSSIAPHFDDFHFWGNQLVTLNLVSSTKLILTREARNLDKFSQNDQSNDSHSNDYEIVIDYKRRSLLILRDEARYEWLHEIRREHIGERRIAVTYRSLGPMFSDQNDQLMALASNRI